jgi:transcriptional regulator with XRE-family HTH domain
MSNTDEMQYRLEWTIGDRMTKARRVGGVSREEMAEYLGMSPQGCGMYEKDLRWPKLAILRLWAMRCGVPLAWLLGADSEEEGIQNLASRSRCTAISAGQRAQPAA